MVGVEPTALCLQSRCSSAELHPRSYSVFNAAEGRVLCLRIELRAPDWQTGRLPLPQQSLVEEFGFEPKTSAVPLPRSTPELHPLCGLVFVYQRRQTSARKNRRTTLVFGLEPAKSEQADSKPVAVGFEPTRAQCPCVFKTHALDRSAKPPISHLSDVYRPRGRGGGCWIRTNAGAMPMRFRAARLGPLGQATHIASIRCFSSSRTQR